MGNSRTYDRVVGSIRSQLCTLGNALHFYLVSVEGCKTIGIHRSVLQSSLLIFAYLKKKSHLFSLVYGHKSM